MQKRAPESTRPRLIHSSDAGCPPPPEPPGDIGVLSTMKLGDRTQWLRVGVARVEAGPGGAGILCVQLGAIPMDRLLYIPMGDVLACYGAMEGGAQGAGHA
jgi:hypothetical protein